MNIDGFKRLKKEKATEVKTDSLIRTMKDDIAFLESKNGNKKIFPPRDLPIVESAREANFKAQREAEERAGEEAERQKKLEEEAERQRIKAQREAEERAGEEAERQKKLEEEAERQRIKAQREAEERAREEAERQKKLEEEAERQRIKAQREAERKEKIRNLKLKLLNNLPKIIAGLVVVILIIGTSVFFYWWNYVRIVPVIVTHFECQNEQCIEVEGEGESECQINDNCKPTVPKNIISASKTETIELKIEEKDLFLDKLKAIFKSKQEKDTFRIILIKLIEDKKTHYSNFNDFISLANISIPESIKESISKSDINGNNYNLFLHSNGEENRLGLIINMKDGSDLAQELNNWEKTIVVDMKSFFFKNEELKLATEDFQDNIYNETAIRYLNLPDSNLTIDYAIINNNLLITTSKESMYALIDALK